VSGLASLSACVILRSRRSVQALEQAIYQWLATWNDHPKTFPLDGYGGRYSRDGASL
jgi:hypothetical protein